MAKKLYVGGLSYNTTEQTMMDTFSQAGAVGSVAVIMDRDTGRSKGFGFVEMGSDEEALKAIEMFNNTTLDERTITVNEARPKPDRDRGGFRSGGGGYRR